MRELIRCLFFRVRKRYYYWESLMSCHQYSDTDQVSSLSCEYNQKQYITRAMLDDRFYEYLACIVWITGSEFDIMKKSLTTRKNAYIELILHKKFSVLS